MGCGPLAGGFGGLGAFPFSAGSFGSLPGLGFSDCAVSPSFGLGGLG